MKKISFLLFLVVCVAYGQKDRKVELGKATLQELEMLSYNKDSSANALVLEERGSTYLSEKHNLDFKTDIYRRIKLFDKKEFSKGTITISLFNKEEVRNIEAFSYQLINGEIKKTRLEKRDIFKKDINERWKEVVFTIPNLHEGGIIEYKYSIISPYSTVNNWYFQSDIPKIKSDYTFSYLGNYKYNIRLVGNLKLDRDSTFIKRNCVYVQGVGNGTCGVVSYGMDSIQAFKSERYMLSKENFISHISFDLVSITDTDGRVKKYTQSWKDADRNFKENFLDGQVNKKIFFKKNLPQDILSISSPLERAKLVYKYIQERFTWNERYWTTKKIRVRDAFNNQKGGVDAINLSLYNSLQAANIESYIMMIATRNRALPTKLFPVTNDFNYIVVKAVVNGEIYYLDATGKFLSFGQLPMRCLNGEGRVLDFKNGSYWEFVKPILKNDVRIFVQLSIDKSRDINGIINVSKKGYLASNTRKELSEKSKEDYLGDLESDLINFEISKYESKNLSDLDKPLMEYFTFVSEESISGENSIRINPFFYFRITSNPFQLEERNYPVDFAYPRTYNYTLNLKIPEGFEIGNIPKDIAIKTPGKGASFVYRTNISSGILTVNYRYKIKKKVFSSEEYHYLKKFFSSIISLHNSSIELKSSSTK